MVELEATLPPMEEICVTNVHMVKHIPSRLRKRWGDILKAIFWKIAQNDSTSSRGWVEYAMVSRCLWQRLPKGGRRHRRTITGHSEYSRRMDMIEDG